MKRIAIVGNTGAEKSYLARRLGSSLGLPVIALYDLFWMPPVSIRRSDRPTN